MAATKISQREARRLRAQVRELLLERETRGNAWMRTFPGGVEVCRISNTPSVASLVRLARKLGHYVVCTVDGDDSTIIFHAVRP